MNAPQIHVDNEDALVDDVIIIRVTGLMRHQHVTVHVAVKEKEVEFAACGCFRADDYGVVDMTKSPSLQGTYTGVSAMGLFWSMRPVPGMPTGVRLFKRNASTPVLTNVRVLADHLGLDEIYDSPREPIAERKIRRWYLAKDVRKIPVKEGRIRGTLFLPPGKGPFPGILEMFGGAGSLVEFRAALLASRGFACLALAYFAYDDLPKRLEFLEVEYFLEASDWLSSHPSVKSDGIGVIGVSKGGEISILLGYHSPQVLLNKGFKETIQSFDLRIREVLQIKAVVSINGAPFLYGSDLSYQGRLVPSPKWDWSDIELAKDGVRYFNSFNPEDKEIIPLWKRDVKTLLVVGGDDQCVNCRHLMDFRERYPTEMKQNVEVVVYPGAGHLIEPPYAPFCRSSLTKSPVGEDIPILTLWGGQLVAHAHAQEDSWRRILDFFKRELTGNTSDVDSKTNSRL